MPFASNRSAIVFPTPSSSTTEASTTMKSCGGAGILISFGFGITSSASTVSSILTSAVSALNSSISKSRVSLMSSIKEFILSVVKPCIFTNFDSSVSRKSKTL